jgi:hypothetical protein
MSLTVPVDARLRLVLATPGTGSYAVLEVPVTVRTVDTGAALVVTIAPPELSAVLAQPAPLADREHTLLWTNGEGLLELPVLLEQSALEWRLIGNGPLRHISHRQFTRLLRRLPITLDSFDDNGPLPPLHGTTLDISPGGALCSLAGGVPPVGSAVTLTFHLPDGNLAGSGIVVRHATVPDGRAAAVRFDEPDLVENALLHLDIARFLGGQG